MIIQDYSAKHAAISLFSNKNKIFLIYSQFLYQDILVHKVFQMVFYLGIQQAILLNLLAYSHKCQPCYRQASVDLYIPDHRSGEQFG